MIPTASGPLVLSRRRLLAAAGAAVLAPGPLSRALADAERPRHAIAMHGAPAMPEGFAAFPYVNPDAPKGGRLTQGLLGTFDSLNPFVVRGVPVQAVRGYVVESLMARGYDEPFTLYGLLARTVETDDARSFVAFGIDPDARFADGQPVTADDVVFSWDLLREHGRPNYRTYYAKVVKAEAIDPRTVRFDLSGAEDRELPLILGLMPILPRHAVDPDTFEQATLTPLMGSGPYVVESVDAGRSVVFARNPDYWGRDRAVNRGFWNFDTVRLDFYRDVNAYFEAFRKGLFDLHAETDPGRWTTGYDFPAVRDGRVVKEAFSTGLPRGMLAFVFNTRRNIFADIRVREALIRLFDFEWIDRAFFYGLYARTGSYFAGSELAFTGRPADATERALLAPFPDAVLPAVMDGSWQPPKSDGSGRDRDTLKAALALLAAAGWEIENQVLTSKATGAPFSFEILVTTKDQERLALTYAQNLRRAGIVPEVRVVDAVQYEQRKIGFDFDMIQNRWDASLSPGNEQAFYWGSAAAGQPGSRNYMGVRSEAVDATIAALLAARTRKDFVSAVRALDRVLISGQYVVPLYHLPDQWVARWRDVMHPQKTSLSGYLPETWWRDSTP
ncbi:ABC transporter, periplasmic substrate-binding protein [Rhodovulum sp. PH10]|uniref:extracellular solute-binding protein n=1 Tax=Rhodovulum sp. PH10 TaxID=1187851 RepID=UPI00027C2A3B|nr:extracellular solute-binding protein [Rhodovulum sp. PH10]EJW11670.1 ABC transporter, periplasmic substrate-binding protein [Rhodovulum sp. PH10]